MARVVLPDFYDRRIVPAADRLGLFARLAPPGLGATAVAAWYLAIFTGSLFAGMVGGLWSLLDRSSYFALLAVIAGMAALFLHLLDSPIQRIDRQ